MREEETGLVLPGSAQHLEVVPTHQHHLQWPHELGGGPSLLYRRKCQKYEYFTETRKHFHYDHQMVDIHTPPSHSCVCWCHCQIRDFCLLSNFIQLIWARVQVTEVYDLPCRACLCCTTHPPPPRVEPQGSGHLGFETKSSSSTPCWSLDSLVLVRS